MHTQHPSHPEPSPQPTRRRTPIVAASIAALVVLMGIVVGGLVIVGDSDDESVTSGDDRTTSDEGQPEDEASADDQDGDGGDRSESDREAGTGSDDVVVIEAAEEAISPLTIPVIPTTVVEAEVVETDPASTVTDGIVDGEPAPVEAVESPEAAPVESQAPSASGVSRGPGFVPTGSFAAASATRAGSVDACENPTRYDPGLLTDGATDTAWMVTGDGVGVTVTIQLPQPLLVSEVGLIPGYDKQDPCSGRDRFFDMRHVSAVRWDLGGAVVEQSFARSRAMQSVTLTEPVVTSSVSFTILGSFPPGLDRLDHTPVSEVVIA